MPTENTGRELTLQPQSVYLRVFLSEEEETINYWTVNTLDISNDNSVMLACLGRGLIEYARENQVNLVQLGKQYLEKEGKLVSRSEDTELVETISGLIIPFPRIKGNA